MMRQNQKIDTIKLYVHLISKLKKGEEISLSNIMLNTEFKNITNRHIKLMLEIESLHYGSHSPQQIQSAANAVTEERNICKKGSPQAKIFEFLRLKVYSAALARDIQEEKNEQISLHSSTLLQNITGLEQYRFVLQTMFRMRTLLPLLTINSNKLKEKYRDESAFRKVLFIIALVKATINKEEAIKILKSIKQDHNIIELKKPVINFLAAMIKKQKQLIANRGEEESLERSFLPIDKSTMKVIKNSIQNQCKIMINADDPKETFSRIGSNLDETVYLHAFPLVHLYFQKNPQIIQSVKSTELFKYLITSKSFLVQNYLNNSNNSNIGYSKSKTKKRPVKNPKAYEVYLKTSQNVALTICADVSKHGMIFNKHNFGNLNSSKKFVRVNDQHLEYYKNNDATGSCTKWSFSEILGIVYGKSTPRQLQNESDSETCFSIVLKDRTLDLSVESRSQLPQMFSFMRGMSALLNQYHIKERVKADEELQELKQAKKSKVKELNGLISFHDGKMQKLTKGRLLWSELLLSINKKVASHQDGRWSKAQGIKRISSRVSSGSMKKT